MANFIKVKNMQQAANLLEKEDVKVLATMLDTLAVKHGCTMFEVEIYPARVEHIGSRSLEFKAIIVAYGLNQSIKTRFRLYNDDKVVKAEDISLWFNAVNTQKDYPFEYKRIVYGMVPRHVGRVMFWNRVR